jgi:hypothetical protein
VRVCVMGSWRASAYRTSLKSWCLERLRLCACECLTRLSGLEDSVWRTLVPSGVDSVAVCGVSAISSVRELVMHNLTDDQNRR